MEMIIAAVIILLGLSAIIYIDHRRKKKEKHAH